MLILPVIFMPAVVVLHFRAMSKLPTYSVTGFTNYAAFYFEVLTFDLFGFRIFM